MTDAEMDRERLRALDDQFGVNDVDEDTSPFFAALHAKRYRSSGHTANEDELPEPEWTEEDEAALERSYETV